MPLTGAEVAAVGDLPLVVLLLQQVGRTSEARLGKVPTNPIEGISSSRTTPRTGSSADVRCGGAVNDIYDVGPIDGHPDGPTGDIVFSPKVPMARCLRRPGHSDTTNTAGISKIRRIRFINGGNQPPIAVPPRRRARGPSR